MPEFVDQFSEIMPNFELPQGYPPQRVFANLDTDRNRLLDPSEMENIRNSIAEMLAEYKSGSPRGNAAPTPEERQAMKKAAMERNRRAREAYQNGGVGNKGEEGPELSKSEFFKRAAQRSPDEDPHVVFAQVDKDKSGGLSRTEMREYYKDTAKAGKEFLNKRDGDKSTWTRKTDDNELLFGVCTASSCPSVCATKMPTHPPIPVVLLTLLCST